MSMNFLDETDDWPEYQTIRDEIQRLEEEYLLLSRELEAATSGRPSDAAVNDRQAKVSDLRARLLTVQRKLDASLSLYR
jgi:hypothetical protein